MFDIENFPTREMGKDMLSMVSPVYDDSYVGKWIFQILALAMSLASDTIRGMSKEAFPNTATSKTLAMWEAAYGIETNPALSDEERQIAIVAKINYKRQMNPARIAALVAGITGRSVHVRENTAPYTYEVCISAGTSEAVLDTVRAAIEQIQQPKIVAIVFETPVSIRIRAEPKKTAYRNEMTGTSLMTGTRPRSADPDGGGDVPSKDTSGGRSGMLTATALEGFRNYVIRHVAYAMYKIGNVYYKAGFTRVYTMDDGKVAVEFEVDHGLPVQITVSEVQIYGRDGKLWLSSSENIKRKTLEEGVFYRFAIDINDA